MSFDKIKGHDRIVSYFRRAIIHRRLANAYLFCGVEGIGKALFARELAKAILCEQRGSDACEKCSSCRRVNNSSHPDFIWVERERNKKAIAIELVHKARHALGLKPFEGAYRLAVINDAHLLSEEASNSLLKTLEEPPPNSILILVTDSPEGLPATVRSRCQSIYFAPLSGDVIEAAISERETDSARLRFIAYATGGSLGQTLQLLETPLYCDKVWLLEEIERLSTANHLSLSKELIARLSTPEWGLQEKRERILKALDLLILFLRDALLLSEAGKVPFLYNSDQEGLLQRFVDKVPGHRLERMVEAVMLARDAIAGNANQRLALDTLFCEIAQSQETSGFTRDA